MDYHGLSKLVVYDVADICDDDLHGAILNKDEGKINTYIELGLDVNYVFRSASDVSIHGLTLLHVAVARQDQNMARFFISKHCDINRAAHCKSFNGKKSRIAIKRDKDKLQWTCLFRAICTQDVEMVTILVDAGADVNVYDRSDCSAVWHAVDTNNVNIATAVLKSKYCDVNSQDTFGMSPLHVAATHRNERVIRELLKYDVVVDLPQLQGATALYLSCTAGDEVSVKVLLQHGANPNLLDKDGFAPLFAALDKGRSPTLVYALIDAGSYVYSSQIFFTVREFGLLNDNAVLWDHVKSLMDTPRSLKVLSSLAIKEVLRGNLDGLSIYSSLGLLPLPKCLNEYLQLDWI